VDILICNAAPIPRPISLDLGSLDLLQAYVQDQLALAAAPLLTFADMLDDRSGSIVLVSSIFVTQAPPGLHHYVVAKAAVGCREGSAIAPDARILKAFP
jgi:NAD(P)-dependent dehydrogenase (short-subunit alcohol dehydrogenase family)